MPVITRLSPRDVAIAWSTGWMTDHEVKIELYGPYTEAGPSNWYTTLVAQASDPELALTELQKKAWHYVTSTTHAEMAKQPEPNLSEYAYAEKRGWFWVRTWYLTSVRLAAAPSGSWVAYGTVCSSNSDGKAVWHVRPATDTAHPS